MTRSRSETIARFQSQPEIPVLILGAGINGVGLLRELALQGIDALLVDKSDIAAGASSAPSRMIHGGLRYLENRETRLVRESLKERNLLLQNAPHYVKPLATTIPVFHRTSGIFNAMKVFFGLKGKSVNRGALLVKIGLTAYDWYTRRNRVMPKHRLWSKAESLRYRPALNPAIVATATYYDAWISYPERLCIELVNDALQANPRCAFLNYCSLSHMNPSGGVMLEDKVTGSTFEVIPKVVVNATGAWIDQTNLAMEGETSFIGGTKGSHLVINNRELYEATQGQMLFYENAEGRICILFPIHGNVLVGSTDVRIDHPDHVVCEPWEVAYMLESVKQVFPSIDIKPSEIVFRFTGVRPLPHSGAAVTAQISRDHAIRTMPPAGKRRFPVYSLVGGKWTTFRAFSAIATSRIAAYLNVPVVADSEQTPIGGGKDFPTTDVAIDAWLAKMKRLHPALADQRLRLLLARYGTRAEAVCDFCGAGEDRPLRSLPEYTYREIEFLIRSEYVVHLDDLILRRTVMAFTGAVSRPLLEELATLFADVKGTRGVEAQEIARTIAILQEKHQVNIN